jgi:hypothetical protein
MNFHTHMQRHVTTTQPIRLAYNGKLNNTPLKGEYITGEEYAALIHEDVMPVWAQKWCATRFGGVPRKVKQQLRERFSEESYDENTSIAICFGVISEYQGLQKWIKAINKRSDQDIMPSRKRDGKWVDAQFTLWPPYMKAATESGAINGTISHTPARYVFKHGDIRVDLGEEWNGYKPMLHSNPTTAMQQVCSRLGRRIAGDYSRIVKELAGDKDLIPTSATVLVNGKWVVLITAMRDPQKTISKYHVDECGNAIENDGTMEGSSISKAEYALVSRSISDGECDECIESNSFEFDESFQAQFAMEDLEEKLNPKTFTPSMLIAMDYATEMGDLIAFMEGSPVVDETYLELVDQKITRTAKELEGRYRLSIPLASDYEITKKAWFVANMMHEEAAEALDDAMAHCDAKLTQQDFFTMRGTIIPTTYFPFGKETVYGRIVLPAKNPAPESTYLEPSLVYELQRPITSVSSLPMDKTARWIGKAGSVAVNANGQRNQMPQAPTPRFSQPKNGSRLDNVLKALELTGSLRKAVKVANRKASYALG